MQTEIWLFALALLCGLQAFPTGMHAEFKELNAALNGVTCPSNVTFNSTEDTDDWDKALNCFISQVKTAQRRCSSAKYHDFKIIVTYLEKRMEHKYEEPRDTCQTGLEQSYGDFKESVITLIQIMNSQ